MIRLLCFTAWFCLVFFCNACIAYDPAVQKTLGELEIRPSQSLSDRDQRSRVRLQEMKTHTSGSREDKETFCLSPLKTVSGLNPVSKEADSQAKNSLNSLKTVSESTETEQRTTGFKPTPRVPLPPETATVSDWKRTKRTGRPVQVNFDALPLPAFINEVYGNILKKSFEMDSSLRPRRDMVTLRTETPLYPHELDALARQILSNYGVAVESQGNILRFLPGSGDISGEPPLLVSGRTLPEVPISHRPVFQVVPLRVVRNVHVAGWLKQAYKGQKLEIFEDPERNAVLLMGAPSMVEQALKAVRLLDQPYMRGRHSVRIEPVFLGAEELSSLLLEVLNSEGYSATQRPPMGSVIVLPVNAVNAVLVFAADAAVLEHVKEWAKILDHPGQKLSGQSGFFYYQVRNTRAEEMVKMLDKILSGAVSGSSAGDKTQASGSGQLVVDDVRNGVIFKGAREAWEQMLPVIHEMDRPARMVLIEVTVAEVTLNNQEELGIEWLFEKANIGSLIGSLGTLGGLDIGSAGLTYTLDNAGQTRAILNAFAANSSVNILSRPRVMVKSGAAATIDVGTEIPIITSQSTSSDLQQDGTSAILQEVQYRKTGILLDVRPVVHSGNRIDLEITQEVSESKPNTTSSISSPSILTRRINTSLGLKDGGSVLLGGLISSSTDTGYSGVPVLSEIPLLGRLFRVERENKDRTEMIMLIVPYVIDNDRDAEAVTKAFQEKLGLRTEN